MSDAEKLLKGIEKAHLGARRLARITVQPSFAQGSHSLHLSAHEARSASRSLASCVMGATLAVSGAR